MLLIDTKYYNYQYPKMILIVTIFKKYKTFRAIKFLKTIFMCKLIKGFKKNKNYIFIYFIFYFYS